MVKSITVKELIRELKKLDKDNLEVFCTNCKSMTFDGVTKISLISGVKEDQEFVCLIADGDILSI